MDSWVKTTGKFTSVSYDSSDHCRVWLGLSFLTWIPPKRKTTIPTSTYTGKAEWNSPSAPGSLKKSHTCSQRRYPSDAWYAGTSKMKTRETITTKWKPEWDTFPLPSSFLSASHNCRGSRSSMLDLSPSNILEWEEWKNRPHTFIHFWPILLWKQGCDTIHTRQWIKMFK